MLNDEFSDNPVHVSGSWQLSIMEPALLRDMQGTIELLWRVGLIRRAYLYSRGT